MVPSTIVNESWPPERSPNRPAGESRPFQTKPAGVRSSSGSSSARSSASGPSVAASAGLIGPS